MRLLLIHKTHLLETKEKQNFLTSVCLSSFMIQSAPKFAARLPLCPKHFNFFLPNKRNSTNLQLNMIMYCLSVMLFCTKEFDHEMRETMCVMFLRGKPSLNSVLSRNHGKYKL
jgi:hypothetical protein